MAAINYTKLKTDHLRSQGQLGVQEGLPHGRSSFIPCVKTAWLARWLEPWGSHSREARDASRKGGAQRESERSRGSHHAEVVLGSVLLTDKHTHPLSRPSRRVPPGLRLLAETEPPERQECDPFPQAPTKAAGRRSIWRWWGLWSWEVGLLLPSLSSALTLGLQSACT